MKKELFMYTLFGCMTFVVSIASYAFFDMVMGINELIANALSWVLAVSFAYITNKIWVFNAETDGKKEFFGQMFSFFAGRLATLAIEEAMILVFITWMGFPSMAVKVAAQVVVIVLNYVISKLIVFK